MKNPFAQSHIMPKCLLYPKIGKFEGGHSGNVGKLSDSYRKWLLNHSSAVSLTP